MKNVKIVVGANWGDEGKGLMTDYFANKAKENGESCLVVLHNGGAQRGHTVDTPDGLHHVFHHFGSGTLAGADTYCSPDFILNSMIFMKEYVELLQKGITPKIYASLLCRSSTPFDMFINQIAEESRGELRHGSCGVGIWETIRRYEQMKYHRNNTPEKLNLIKNKYVPYRLKQLNIDQKDISDDLQWCLNNEDIIKHYLEDERRMFSIINNSEDTILDRYDTVIFECGQGLGLCEDVFNIHTTPSQTGIKNPMRIVKNLWKDGINVEVCYVTRTYLTRHGAGNLIDECNKKEFNSEMIDMTNIRNPFQGSLRYAPLNVTDMMKRINKDFKETEELGAKKSLAITHMNEYRNEIDKKFDCIYSSDGRTRDSVKVQMEV